MPLYDVEIPITALLIGDATSEFPSVLSIRIVDVPAEDGAMAIQKTADLIRRLILDKAKLRTK
jgi:hypothetical protein